MDRFAIILGACLLVSPANAAVRFFFTSSADKAGLAKGPIFKDTAGNGTDYEDYALKEDRPTVGVPTVDIAKGEFLYLWVAFENEPDNRKIQGIHLVVNSEAFNGGKEEVKRGMYIGNEGDGYSVRWEYGSKTRDPMMLAGVTTPGIKNNDGSGKNEQFLYFSGQDDAAYRVALLGAIDPGYTSDYYGYKLTLGLGTNGVSYKAKSAPKVKFGNNNEQFDGKVRQKPAYLWSSDADAVVYNSIPEPSSLLLLALAALGLRRR